MKHEPCAPYFRPLKGVAAVSLLAILFLAMLVPLVDVDVVPPVMASPDSPPGTLAPSHYWGPFSSNSTWISSGDVQINVTVPGIAVRVEIPRQFLLGVISKENDTHFIQSDIRNDYYYYSVVDESTHWSYGWNGTDSDAPCYKPESSIYDPNAPWCVEIWNYLNGSFKTFTAPKFVRFIGLNAPAIAGLYNFTLYVATQTNALGLPDFVGVSSKAFPFYVPVSMSDDPASITGTICDANVKGCPPILAKGVAYALNTGTGQEAMAYVNQTTGFFNLTGLAPGDYDVQVSAGVYASPYGTYAYSLSDPVPVPGLNRGSSVTIQGLGLIGKLPLDRAPQVCGSIEYHRPGVAATIRALSDHPWLEMVGVKTLNITVEASDQSNPSHVYRYTNNTADLSTGDPFDIITGAGRKYVGLPFGDPYGTEFAGLPNVASDWPMTLSVNVTGYVQPSGVLPVNVSLSTGYGCVSHVTVDLEAGGVISGTIQLVSSLPTGGLYLQTPDMAERTLGLIPTDALFGGNILIQAYDTTQAKNLRGVAVLNGTLPDGRTCYANSTLSTSCRIKVTGNATIQFYVIGFSEYYNRTWSGWWGKEDYGLPDGEYNVTVLIRGYEERYDFGPIAISGGGLGSVIIHMVRGDVIEAGAYSYDTRPGTCFIQAELPFRSLNFSIPARARIYFYDSSGGIVGFVERLVRLNVTNGLSGPSYFKVVFAGQNWSLREIWFFGPAFEPTHLTEDTYYMDGYTLGYVHACQGPVTARFTTLGDFRQVLIILLLGDEISLTAPVFAEPSLLGRIPEHDHALAETFSSSLAGAVDANLTAGIQTLNFTIFGFGGMVQNTTLTGQGHFFYVSHDGARYFDYGLENATYTTQIPEFGFNRHFTPLGSLLTTFNDLFLEQGIFLNVYSMARISSSSSLVMGLVVNPPPPVMPLSWVTVQATNGTITVSVPTLDGSYVGPGALNLPAGTYNITFSVPFYEPPGTPQNPVVTNFAVNWNSDYVAQPTKQYLCPLSDPSICADPPPSPSGSPANIQPLANYMLNNPMQAALNTWLIGSFYIIYERKDL